MARTSTKVTESGTGAYNPNPFLVDDPLVDDPDTVDDPETIETAESIEADDPDDTLEVLIVAQSVNPTERYDSIPAVVRVNKVLLEEGRVEFTYLSRLDDEPFDLTPAQKGDLTHAVKEAVKENLAVNVQLASDSADVNVVNVNEDNTAATTTATDDYTTKQEQENADGRS